MVIYCNYDLQPGAERKRHSVPAGLKLTIMKNTPIFRIKKIMWLFLLLLMAVNVWVLQAIFQWGQGVVVACIFLMVVAAIGIIDEIVKKS